MTHRMHLKSPALFDPLTLAAVRFGQALLTAALNEAEVGGHAACCMPCTVKLISRDTTNRTIRHTCVLCRANVDTLEVSVAPAADDTTAPPSVVRMPSAPQPMLSTAVACTPRELLENLARCGEDGGGELAAAAKSALNKLSMRPTPGCRRPGSAPASQLGFRVRARVRVLRRLSA